MFLKHALFSLQKTEQPISKTIQRMNLLFKTQFPYSDYGTSYDILVLVLKSFVVLFCALFPPFFGFFRYYFKTPKEDYNEALQEIIDFDEIETPFENLSFRFPTYEEFLRTTEEFVDTSIEENSPNSDLDSNLQPRENPQISSPIFLNCTNDIKIEDLSIKDESRENPEISSPNSLNCTIDIKIQDLSIKDNGEFHKLDESVNSNEIECEEDDFIKELQIEIMKAKAKSLLPTIPEETEYPIRKEENFRDTTKEIHKIYTEKMQKFDTLNHQKSYAKELKRKQSKKSVDSVLAKGLCGCKIDKKNDGKTGEDREIEEGLELVYVMQMWISWEFIVWQYKKVLEICGKEGYENCRYNEVAGEFEHFQVVIQRFMEDELFDEGSRFEFYARNRFDKGKFLQVPLIKEDEVKDNENEGFNVDEEDNKDAIKMDRLINILQESIRILWQFIRADKLAHISTLAQQQCRSPTHSKILNQILLDLQKKARKVKKIMKRKNCVKNCKEGLEDEFDDDELYFFAMVDLKLVSRVLNMQRIKKDQLSWCHQKLSSISFPNGKIKRQPSSFLFHSS